MVLDMVRSMQLGRRAEKNHCQQTIMPSRFLTTTTTTTTTQQQQQQHNRILRFTMVHVFVSAPGGASFVANFEDNFCTGADGWGVFYSWYTRGVPEAREHANKRTTRSLQTSHSPSTNEPKEWARKFNTKCWTRRLIVPKGFSKNADPWRSRLQKFSMQVPAGKLTGTSNKWE